MGVRIKAVRLSDGMPVVVEHTDFGDSVPLYDAEEKPFRVYTSHMKTSDGQEFYHQIQAEVAEGSGDPNQFRWSEDVAALHELGYEVADIVDLQADESA